MSGFAADASIPLQAGRGITQPENPLQALGNAANTVNAVNQTKLFPGQLALQGQAVQSGQVGLAQKINQAGYQALAPILAKPQGTITHADFTTALGSIENNLHIPTSGILSDVLATAPSGDGADFDAKIRSIVASRSQETGGPAVAQVTPQTGPTLDVGPTIQPTTVSPAGRLNPGVVTPTGPTYTKGLTPGEAVQPVQVGVTPGGAPIMQPMGASPFANGGRINPPAALRNPNGPGAASGAPPGTVVTGLGTAQTTNLAAQGGTANTAFQQISDQGVQARSQSAVIDNLLNDAAQFSTGPAADTLLKVRQLGRQLGLPVDQESTTAGEGFHKLVSQLADAQGAGSDARLAVNQGANPSSSLTPAGIQFIGRQLQGNADYLQARAKLASEFPDQTNNRGFETQIGSNLDPRVFQYARMTPEQKGMYLTHIGDFPGFIRKYNWAVSHGLVAAPQATPVAAPAATAAPVAAATSQATPSIPRGE